MNVRTCGQGLQGGRHVSELYLLHIAHIRVAKRVQGVWHEQQLVRGDVQLRGGTVHDLLAGSL